MAKTIAERTSARIARNAKPRERNIRDALDERVKQYGGVTRAVAWLGRTGAPDVLCLFPQEGQTWFEPNARPGTNTWVETKMGRDGKLSVAQKTEHATLRAAGCKVLVIATLEQLDAWLPPL